MIVTLSSVLKIISWAWKRPRHDVVHGQCPVMWDSGVVNEIQLTSLTRSCIGTVSREPVRFGRQRVTGDRQLTRVDSVSVVIPVYSGAVTLPGVVKELKQLRSTQETPDGREFRVDEVLLVWDRGIRGSEEVVRELAARDEWIRPVWLSSNFGQHPATLAGMTSSGGDWIVTMDEDGQHDPAYIGDLLDKAYRDRTQLVYASPMNRPPHGVLRNAASWLTKWLFVHILVSSDGPRAFNSYRLILGEAGRTCRGLHRRRGVSGRRSFLGCHQRPRPVRCSMRQEGRTREQRTPYRRLVSPFLAARHLFRYPAAALRLR